MWKPPLEQNTLECLGPENCGGLNCEKNWTKCYTDKDKGCHKWWPDLDKNEKDQVEALCAKTKKPVNKRTDLDAPVERQDKFNENGMLRINYTDCQRKDCDPKLVKCDPTLAPDDAGGCKCSPGSCKCFTDDNCAKRSDSKDYKPRVGTKFRYAVDIEIKRTYYHDSPQVAWDTINDPALRQRVERLVAEKCRYGGAYYKLTHYGRYIPPPDQSDDGRSCDEIRDPDKDPDKDKDKDKDKEEGCWESPFGATCRLEFLRWLRQKGFDGWFWGMLGKAPHGFLTTPLLLPWEVDRCASVPCPGQCIAVSADSAEEDCPASSAFWPVRMLGRIVTEILMPLLGLRLALYLSGSIVSRLRCCPMACKDCMRQVNILRRSCWFWVKKAGRKVGRRWLCLI
jgi:hypothetical protein